MNAKQLDRLNKRAECDRAGYPASVVNTVIATPRLSNGVPVVWGHNQNPGPLDGQPSMDYTFRAEYVDGVVVEVRPGAIRSRPWPGGKDTV